MRFTLPLVVLALVACDTDVDPVDLSETAQPYTVAGLSDVSTCGQPYVGANPRGTSQIAYSVPTATVQSCPTPPCGAPAPGTKSFPLGTFRAGHRVTVGNCGLASTWEMGTGMFGGGSSDLEIRTAPNGGGTLVGSATSGCGRADRFFTTFVAPSNGTYYAWLKNASTTSSVTGVLRVNYGEEGLDRTYDLASGESIVYNMVSSGPAMLAGTTITLGNCGMSYARSESGNIQFRLEDTNGAPLSHATVEGCGSTDHDRMSTVLQKTVTPFVRLTCLATPAQTRCRGALAKQVRLDSNPGLADPVDAFLDIGGTQTGGAQYKTRGPGLAQYDLHDVGGDPGWPSNSASSLLIDNYPTPFDWNISEKGICDTTLLYHHAQGLQRTRQGRFLFTANEEDVIAGVARNGGTLQTLSPYVRPVVNQSLYDLRAQLDPYQNGFNRGVAEGGRMIGRWYRDGSAPTNKMNHPGGFQLLGNYAFTTLSTQFDCTTAACFRRKVQVFDTTSSANSTVCGLYDFDDPGTGSPVEATTEKGTAIAIARVFTTGSHPRVERVVMGIMSDSSGHPHIDLYEKRADSDGYVDPLNPVGWVYRGDLSPAHSPYFRLDGDTGQYLEGPEDHHIKYQNFNFISGRDGNLYMVAFSRGLDDYMPECVASGSDCRSYFILYRIGLDHGGASCVGPECTAMYRMWALDVGPYDNLYSIDSAGAYIDSDNERILAYMSSKNPTDPGCYRMTLREY